MTTMRTVYLLGGPRDGTRTLACAEVSLADLLNQAYIAGHDEHGEDYLYSILGPMKNGELLAVEV